MRKVLCTLMLASSISIQANHPDSLYIRPDVVNGSNAMQISYSIDKKHWKHLDHNLFQSDYGPWGSQKKLYFPVIEYDGKEYHATFIPDPKVPQIAVTRTRDLALWKPQDYPQIEKSAFEKILMEQQKKSANNVIKIPYDDFLALINRQKTARYNAGKEAENYVETGTWIKDAIQDIDVTMNINWHDCKLISKNLMGVFFEDISYAADGGLYAELIQNRDFEYSGKDHKGWTSLTAWRMEGEGTTLSIATENPLHANNSHYAILNTSKRGARLINEGWDGIPVKAKEKYVLSMFLKGKGTAKVSLMADGKYLASTTIKATNNWSRQSKTIVANASADNAVLVIEPLQEGNMALDFVSLFPKNTFKGRENGLRKDLAEMIAELHPRFVRFPGGCASHGNGIDNIYHWQATIGDLWKRKGDFNIWHYHQTRGLGFYEYFLFCEDIGAEPLPVLAAGVPCQNSSVGGNGQQGGIPFEKDLLGKPSPYIYNGKPLTMESYLQELMDLIEWANGDAKTSKLATMRAKAGHPKPFNMKYLGIGNEDLLGDVFMERYRYLVDGIRKAHPEITIVGTVGPFWEGSDYEYGWEEAKKRNIEIVDEHYYNTTGWYFNNRDFYDKYDRNGTKVYLGEWASKGNNAANALVEAAYMTNVERNADVVVMTSYAPLLAKKNHTNWTPDLIYFDNTSVSPTPNYYVQRAFGTNSGDTYVFSDLKVNCVAKKGGRPDIATIENRIDKSVVIDSRTGDAIVKIVSMLPNDISLKINNMDGYDDNAVMTVMATPETPDHKKQWVKNEEKNIQFKDRFSLPAYSFAVIRIKKANQ